MTRWLDEVRDVAGERVTPDAWHYIQRGASTHDLVKQAPQSWSKSYRLRPRVLRDVTSIDSSLSLYGEWQAPVGIAPTAFHRLCDATDGERATARAAAALGIPLVLSTRCSVPLEEVAAAVAGPWWFQVYLMHSRAITEAIIARAVAAGARALVLTGDTPYVGYQAADGSPRPLPMGDDILLANVRQHLDPAELDPWSLVDQSPGATLADVTWLAERFQLPVIVKGVLRADDANDCLAAGASGVWVSNHGGRQLDRSVSSARALPEVVDAVAGRGTVLVDGGIRSGLDALTALALGADAVFLGRPTLWGLAAAGQAGVETVLGTVIEELCHAMGLAGAATLADLGDSFVAAR